ncbi:MAG: TetR/AcrR family transcriptional regulator [Gemmatimonadota bacterium]
MDSNSSDPPAADCPAPRWQRRPEARREEILEAALIVFGEHGYAGTPLEEVARRAGISKGTLYLYFDSKETLFRETVRASIVTSVVAGEEMLRNHVGSWRELLEAIAQRMWDTVRRPETAKISRLVQSELTNFPELARFYFEEVILRVRRIVEVVLVRGAEAGEFRVVDPSVTGRLLPLMMVNSAQNQRFFQPYDSQPLTDEQAFHGALDLFLRGVLPPTTDLSRAKL